MGTEGQMTETIRLMDNLLTNFTVLKSLQTKKHSRTSKHSETFTGTSNKIEAGQTLEMQIIEEFTKLI